MSGDARPAHLGRIGRHDEWETPPEIFRQACEASGIIPRIDVYATRGNAKCRSFLDRSADGLRTDWPRVPVWCNPPYSDVKSWVRRVCGHWMGGGTALCLVFAKTDMEWFHRFVWSYARIWWWPRRIKFLRAGVEQGSAPFSSMLLAYDGWRGRRAWGSGRGSVDAAAFYGLAGAPRYRVMSFEAALSLPSSSGACHHRSGS